MLYQAMKKELQSRFPFIEYTIDDDKKLITIPNQNKLIGNLDIQDDSDELTIFIGKFTHWHCGYYDKNSNNKNQINETISEMSEFLSDLFNDRIFLWGSEICGGGFKYIDENFTTKAQGYVWSGRYKQ